MVHFMQFEHLKSLRDLDGKVDGLNAEMGLFHPKECLNLNYAN